MINYIYLFFQEVVDSVECISNDYQLYDIESKNFYTMYLQLRLAHDPELTKLQ